MVHRMGSIPQRRRLLKANRFERAGRKATDLHDQRSSYEHCDKGKPGVTRGRKATGLPNTKCSLDSRAAAASDGGRVARCTQQPLQEVLS